MIVHIHIPKTGGTSFKNALSETMVKGRDFYSNHYYDKTKIKELIGDKEYDDSIKVTIVRNPFDRIISLYCFLIQRWELILPDFNTWVKNVLATTTSIDIAPCYDWITEDGKYIVTDILKFENYENDFKDFLSKYNLKAGELLQHKKTNHLHYSKYYNEESKKIVYDLYEKDFEQFNYKY